MSYVSDYDFEMRELARGAEALHRRLKEVYFINSNNDSILIFEDGTYLPTQHRKYGYYIQREQYSFKVAANLGGTDPFTLLTFGYSGTGPRCYADFLLACGFSGAYYEVIKVLSPPVKLKRDGSQVKGKYREAQSQIVASGKTLEEARQNLAKEQEQKQEKIKVRLPAESCLLAEEVLCDGELVKTITEVIAGSEEEAEKKALKEISKPGGAMAKLITNFGFRPYPRMGLTRSIGHRGHRMSRYN